MWSAFTRAALAAVALVGCGPRALDLALTVDASGCTLAVPAGGSLSYQVEANDSVSVDGGPGSFCGGCLAVDAALSGSDALVAFLRAHAPSCGGVRPGTTLAVRVTGWASGGCPAANAPGFCADAPSQLVPDGTSDATLSFDLACKAQCASTCTPTTCAAQGKDCGAISDGCNMVLDCGTCHPPLRCGAVTANVCAK
jgi:hypothetical protein